MDLTDIISGLTGFVSEFARANPLVFFGALAIIAFLIYRKPMFFLAVFGLGLLLAAVVYIIMDMASSGVSKKQQMIHKEVPVDNIFRPPGLKLRLGKPKKVSQIQLTFYFYSVSVSRATALTHRYHSEIRCPKPLRSAQAR